MRDAPPADPRSPQTAVAPVVLAGAATCACRGVWSVERAIDVTGSVAKVVGRTARSRSAWSPLSDQASQVLRRNGPPRCTCRRRVAGGAGRASTSDQAPGRCSTCSRQKRTLQYHSWSPLLFTEQTLGRETAPLVHLLQCYRGSESSFRGRVAGAYDARRPSVWPRVLPVPQRHRSATCRTRARTPGRCVARWRRSRTHTSTARGTRATPAGATGGRGLGCRAAWTGPPRAPRGTRRCGTGH
jgi:hypothetical protein